MRRTDGFTLFEVLGAVALLAIVYTMLSTAAIRGLRSEGQSRRILEASLIADWQLADIEMQIDQGLVPEIGSTETEQDDFRIRVDVDSFDLPEISSDAPNLLAAGSSDSVAPGSGSVAIFGEESPLREIHLVVSWGNPEQPQSVTRTTYAFDASAFQVVPATSPSSAQTPGSTPSGSTPTPPTPDRGFELP
jgi:hypothetical protein